MPQQRWAGRVTSTPFLSRTATAARPVAGSLYSTEHVAKKATRSRAGSRRGASLRPSNQREKVSRWKAGRFRLAWMPTVISMNFRFTHIAFIQFETGAVRLPSRSTSSVLPRKRSRSVTPFWRASAERARSMRRGKSTAQRCGGV